MLTMQQELLMLVATALPILALSFSAALLSFKLFITVRSRYDIKVNCWFCNENTRVAYVERNSWTCPKCDQYNGFNKDGDYNRDLNTSSASSSASASRNNNTSNHSNNNSNSSSSNVCANAYYSNDLLHAAAPPSLSNGLCDQCNEAQRLKVEKLAQFEPKHESRFEQELKLYQRQLEQQFRLCGSCERHVNKVLHEKKKMVLGSKFLNFIIKGAALLKQPHFNRLARVQQQRRLQRYELQMTLLTVLNVLCLLFSLPAASREQFQWLLSDTLGNALFFVYSHALTLFRVTIETLGNVLAEQALLARLMLFGRTMGRLLLYSLGLNQQATFSSCYISIYPFVMLALSFLHNIGNGLKFTRFTLLLVVWSIYAQGSLLLPTFTIHSVTFIMLGSLCTLLLLITNRKNSLLSLAQNESVRESFHRLYADEGFSDDESISMLSQQLSCNGSQTANSIAMSSISSLNGSQLRQRNNVSHIAPSVLSLDSLHLSHAHPLAFGLVASSESTHIVGAHKLCLQLSGCSASMAWQQRCSVRLWLATWQRREFKAGAIDAEQASSSTDTFHQQSAVAIASPATQQPQQQQQLHRNGDVSAWVYANNDCRQLNVLEEPNTANLMGCCDDKQLSRTSSQSSGFESQLGHNNQQQPHQQQQPTMFGYQSTQPSEYGWQTTSQRQLPGMGLRVAPPMPSPYATQSEFNFERTLPVQANPELRPGDLLRKWIDHNSAASAAASQKG
ncbi:LOW QUALITY PROTEIN: uncharacterized protein LOC133847436 [Drosophila sulfurigaster albostrigata]|uniref:LOW QUALITY PROTEIN: uncharacterized protein LOC133847436 n=1 Tax=Drosophila sulfurigaster albostrigata TaxID=89887 RepID=UPI002D219294|nr:LOW QUALITY PROTEIN: uncharacterized protein LOC133847436 [Drosophila sulfurigaster albostrigata]